MQINTTSRQKSIHTIGGGTLFHVRPHLALAAPAYGATPRHIDKLCKEHPLASDYETFLHLTRMANQGQGNLETNENISRLLDQLIADPSTKILFMPVALCDFEGSVLQDAAPTPSGKNQPRLQSRVGPVTLELQASDKLIGKIRKTRKDIFLVGFKTTAGATADEQYLAGLRLLKTASCNLVLANDLHTGLNTIVAPELARYGVTTSREEALKELVDMALRRSQLTFTRTTLSEGSLIPWDSPHVPAVLRQVVDYCVEHGAYKPFNNVTVGHFAYKEAENKLLSSRRKMNYNNPQDRDMVRVVFTEDQVIAYGAKPSAGSRSQYEVLRTHPQFNCIVHFHCPIRPGSQVAIRSQREFECGSHECGQNTHMGICQFGNLGAVMLDQHGPNIIFKDDADPQEIIRFIDENFDLSTRTDGI